MTNKNYRGFSFIEVMLAVFLIVVGMLAAMALLTSGLRESMDSRNQIIAGLLAQEGVEAVRNIRDRNWMQGEASFQGINAGTCTVQVPGGQAEPGLTCPAADTVLKLTNLYYNHAAEPFPITRFSRQVVIQGAGTDRTVTSMVIWAGSSFPVSVNNCTTASRCAYTQITLTEWGG